MPRKKTVSKSSQPETAVAPVKNVPVPEVSQTQNIPAGNLFRRPAVLILIVLVILGFVFYYLRKWLVVAEVNGQPISRLEYTHQLELQNGSTVLNELVAKTLILQEADRKHITVTQAEINKRFNDFQNTLAKQGKTFDQYLTSAKPMTRQDFTDDLRIQIMLEKLLAKDINVTDKEVNDYIDQNKDSIPQTIKPSDLKQQVKLQLQQTKLQEKLPSFIQELQKKAKIVNLAF